MARPSMTAEVLEQEGRSHRTKAELKARKAGEAAQLTGKPLRERKAVRENEAAHREFKRVAGLLSAIGKGEALYEAIINRYCLLQGECGELEGLRKAAAADLDALRADYQAGKIKDAQVFYKLLSGAQKNLLDLDKQLQAKRKMALDIEKECAMTISSAARSVPKKPEADKSPLLEVLAEGGS